MSGPRGRRLAGPASGGRARRPHPAQTRGDRRRRRRARRRGGRTRRLRRVRLTVDGRHAAVARRPAGLVIAAVAGFPSGKHSVGDQGRRRPRWPSRPAPREIDMVIDIGAALAGDFAEVRVDIAAVAGRDPGRRAQGHRRVGGAAEPLRRRHRWSRCAGPPTTPAPISSRRPPAFIRPAARRCRGLADGRHGRRAARREGQRRHPDRGRRASRCSTPVPPGSDCPGPGRCSTASASASARSQPCEAGVLVGRRHGRVLRRELARHPGIGDLDAVGLNAHADSSWSAAR